MTQQKTLLFFYPPFASPINKEILVQFFSNTLHHIFFGNRPYNAPKKGMRGSQRPEHVSKHCKESCIKLGK